MIYTVIMNNGRSYDLPPKTIKIAEGIERVANLNSVNKTIREKYKVLFDELMAILGEENVKEILGTSDFNSCDLSDISIAYQKVINAYSRPEQEFQLEDAIQTFDKLPIDKITSLANATSKIKEFK